MVVMLLGQSRVFLLHVERWIASEVGEQDPSAVPDTLHLVHLRWNMRCNSRCADAEWEFLGRTGDHRHIAGVRDRVRRRFGYFALKDRSAAAHSTLPGCRLLRSWAFCVSLLMMFGWPGNLGAARYLADPWAGYLFLVQQASQPRSQSWTLILNCLKSARLDIFETRRFFWAPLQFEFRTTILTAIMR